MAMAKVRVGINGFGRVGRCFMRALHDDPAFDVVLVNDITSPKQLAHLLKYDSVHGRFAGAVAVEGEDLVVDGKRLLVTKETDPAKLPWRQHGVEVVLESTGRFTDRAGA